MKSVTGQVVSASYVSQIRCIMLTLKDNNGRILKPIALYEENFTFKPGQNIDAELEKTTTLFRNYKFPITIAYEEKRQ